LLLEAPVLGCIPYGKGRGKLKGGDSPVEGTVREKKSKRRQCMNSEKHER
jgi:hypothetical protein